jgi:hypothetical protein
MSKEIKYYTTERIDRENADYNIIFGERSNGKTTAILKKGIRIIFHKGCSTWYCSSL